MIGFGIYFGVTAGPPWAKTIGGIIVVAVILALLAIAETVWRERGYYRRGLVPEYRPLSLSRALLGLCLNFFKDGALLAVVAATVYGITRLVR